MSQMELLSAPGETRFQACVELAKRLAPRVEYLTVDTLRLVAMREGVLPAESRGRALSFLGGVLRAAGYQPTDQFHRSQIGISRGNLLRVWRAA